MRQSLLFTYIQTNQTNLHQGTVFLNTSDISMGNRLKRVKPCFRCFPHTRLGHQKRNCFHQERLWNRSHFGFPQFHLSSALIKQVISYVLEDQQSLIKKMFLGSGRLDQLLIVKVSCEWRKKLNLLIKK